MNYAGFCPVMLKETKQSFWNMSYNTKLHFLIRNTLYCSRVLRSQWDWCIRHCSDTDWKTVVTKKKKTFQTSQPKGERAGTISSDEFRHTDWSYSGNLWQNRVLNFYLRLYSTALTTKPSFLSINYIKQKNPRIISTPLTVQFQTSCYFRLAKRQHQASQSTLKQNQIELGYPHSASGEIKAHGH